MNTHTLTKGITSSPSLAAIYLQKDRSFFFSMKTSNPIKYRFILFYGKGNLIKGYEKFNEYKSHIQQEYDHIYETYIEFASTKERVKFIKLLIDEKIYKNYASTSNAMLRLHQGYRQNIHGLKKMRKIINVSKKLDK